MDVCVSSSRTSRRGVWDFIIQRLSAVVIGTYVVHLVIIFSLNGDMDYAAWRSYFGSGYALLLSSLTVLALVVHGWVGMWTVGTDYIRGQGRAAKVRLFYQMIVGGALFAYLVWALSLIWGPL